MPGMYPDDQLLEIFGEQVMYPGLDPETQKFTDGDFSNPLIKPSYIPAATFNLMLDNMENLISAMGLDPNNTDPEQLKKAMQRGFAPRSVGEYHDLSYYPSVTELVRLRYLPLQYQIIKIALYEELCAIKWVGAEFNDTAYFWYKCDEDGTRNVDGLFMRVEDGRAIFRRGAGKNAVFKAADDTPYDGKDVGNVMGDTIRNLTGYFAVRGTSDGWVLRVTGGGVFRPIPNQQNQRVTDLTKSTDQISPGMEFNASLQVPTSYENRPFCGAVLFLISY